MTTSIYSNQDADIPTASRYRNHIADPSAFEVSEFFRVYRGNGAAAISAAAVNVGTCQASPHFGTNRDCYCPHAGFSR